MGLDGYKHKRNVNALVIGGSGAGKSRCYAIPNVLQCGECSYVVTDPKGEILRIPDSEGLKIPHMGWNSLHLENDGRLFRGISEGAHVYFVHSYYLKAADESIVKASTEYSTHIHASVEKDNVFACQFHPEKSSDVGLHILKNFVEL